MTEVQNIFTALREKTEESEYMIECKGPGSLNVVNDFHDIVTVFQLLKEDGCVVHAFGNLQ